MTSALWPVRFPVRTLTLLAAVVAVAVLAGFAWTAVDPTPTAEAQTSMGEEAVAACCCSPGVFTGTDTTGSFEGAISAAVAKAATCAGCCDRLVDYRVTQITGRVGGIASLNDITVEIVASW